MSALVSLEQTTSPVPLQYEAAIQALAECTSVDETKYWDNRADALAAWARIVKSREAEIQAKRLKLYAYRRMGQLAIAIRPFPLMRGGGQPGARGRLEGPVGLLRQHGLSQTQASAARYVGQVTEEEFQRLLTKPLAPTTFAQRNLCKDPLWMTFCRTGMSLRVFLRRHPAKELYELARGLGERQEQTARELIKDLLDLLSGFAGDDPNDRRRGSPSSPDPVTPVRTALAPLPAANYVEKGRTETAERSERVPLAREDPRNEAPLDVKVLPRRPARPSPPLQGATWSSARDALLIRICRKRGCSCEDAKEVVQEAHLRLFEYQRKATVTDPDGLLRRIVLNLCINLYHRGESNRFSFVSVEKLARQGFLIHPAADPERALVAEQELGRLVDLLSAVSSRTCQIFIVQRVGYSYQEIAVASGIRPRTVEKHVFTAIEALIEHSAEARALFKAKWSKGTQKSLRRAELLRLSDVA